MVLCVVLFAGAGALAPGALAAPAITATPNSFGSGQTVVVDGTGFAAGQDVNVWFDGNNDVLQGTDEPSAVAHADSSGAFSGVSLVVRASEGGYFIRAGSPAVALAHVALGSCLFQICVVNGNQTVCMIGNAPGDTIADCKVLDSSYTDPQSGYDFNDVGPRFAGAGVLAAAVNSLNFLGLPGPGCVAMTAAIAEAENAPYFNTVPGKFDLFKPTQELLNIACGPPFGPAGFIGFDLPGYSATEAIAGHGADPAMADAAVILGIVTAAQAAGTAFPPALAAAQFAFAKAAVAGAIVCGFVDYYCNGSDITANILRSNVLQGKLVPVPFLNKRWGDIIGWAKVACTDNTMPALKADGSPETGNCELPGHQAMVPVPGSAGPDNIFAVQQCATGTVTGLSIGYDGDLGFDVNDGSISETGVPTPGAPTPNVAQLTNYHNFQAGPGGSEPPGGIDIEVPLTDRGRFLPLLVQLRKGVRVKVCGFHVADMHMLWNELHPMTSLAILPALPVDSTPPVITSHVAGTLGSNGWYRSDVAVTWTVADPDSPVTSTTGCGPTTIAADTDAAGQTVTCSATNAGGTSADGVTIKRDTTPPTIGQTVSPAAPDGTNGWYRTAPTVTFSCSDAASDIDTCPAPATLGEGASQTVSGTATDRAGNTASTSVAGFDVDLTPPTLSGAATTPPNAAGWYAGDVVVHWTCADALSGVAGLCPADEAITGEGASLAANRSVSDAAGNVASATSAPVAIDRTPPLTSATAPSGWSNSGITVGLSALDNLSGVAATYYRVDGGAVLAGSSVTIDDEGVHTIAFWSVDRAGNVEQQKTVAVLIDRTAPTIGHALDPVPNGAGWNRTAVTVTFTCADSLSGITFCTPAQSLTGDGQSQVVHGLARDAAGNTAQDTAFVSIDKAPPTIGADTDRPANANGWYNAAVRVSFTCADALSGIAFCPPSITLVEGADQSASGTARDTAGNTASTTLAHLNVDTTAPVVTYTGNAGVYTVDLNVAITCTASDALSGVASTTCANVNGPAWSFGLGTTSRSASALDRAGTTGTGSTSFTVIVTAASLDNLITRFFGSDQTGSSGLIAKVGAIVSAPNANAKSGKLGAFDNQVDAKTGNPLTAAQAALLKQLAAAL